MITVSLAYQQQPVVVDGIGIPRDGGMADLLAEAGGPAPAFAAVVCEDINRSARDTFNALKLEKELAAGGITLFATNEPVFLEGANATILLRRMKQRHRRVLPAADQRGLLERPDRAHHGRVEHRPGPLYRGLGTALYFRDF